MIERFQRWGPLLLVLGIGSFVLPMIGMQFRVLNLFGDAQPLIGIVMAIVGAVLTFGSRFKKSSPAPATNTPAAAAPTPAPVRHPSAPVRASAAPAQHCGQCGNELLAGDRFCGRCGSPAASPAQVDRHCGQCGRIVAPSKKFCSGCGTPVG